MFCNSCGQQISDTAKFCNRCGAPTSGGTVISNSTPTPEPQVFQNDYYPNPVTESASTPAKSVNGAKIAKYILLAFCILFTAIAQIMSLFSPVLKYSSWSADESVVEFALDTDSVNSCTYSCEQLLEKDYYEFTPYSIDMYQVTIYFLIGFLVSAFAFTSMGRYKAIGIGKLITAFCCCITAFISVFFWNLSVKYDLLEVYPDKAFYWILILYLGAVILGIVSNKMDYTPPVRTGYATAAAGGSSLFSRAMPKHIHEEIICDNDYPTTSDFERLIYKANLRTHLADSTPNQRLFNSVNQHIYKAFYTATNRHQANSQMFTYSDKDNNIYGLITVNGRTLTIDLKVNM